MRFRSVSVALLAAAVTVTAGCAVTAGVISSDISAAEARVAVLETRLHAAEATAAGATSALDDAEAKAASMRLVLDERPAFVDAVAKAEKALKVAGKLDVKADRAKVLAAQEKVRAETLDPEVVKTATRDVLAVAKSVNARVAEEKKRAAARTPAGVLAEFRATLDAIGGEWVNVTFFDGWCGGKKVNGCNFSATDIRITKALGNERPSVRRWVAYHELAHSYQRLVWSDIYTSPVFKSLFRSNIELLANCMAYSQGSPREGHHCSDRQIRWAANIYDGRVPKKG